MGRRRRTSSCAPMRRATSVPIHRSGGAAPPSSMPIRSMSPAGRPTAECSFRHHVDDSGPARALASLALDRRWSMADDRTKFVLGEDRIPRSWYNIVADLPVPPHPVLHPGTGQPIGPDDLAPLFPMALIGQEVRGEREIEIPGQVRDAYRLYRPSPVMRARRLEKALDTPAHIYFKYEGVSPAGSHKPNTAIAQAFYNKE